MMHKMYLSASSKMQVYGLLQASTQKLITLFIYPVFFSAYRTTIVPNTNL